MDNLTIKERLLEFQEAERYYKKLYELNPILYKEPIWNWTELVKKLNKEHSETVSISPIPPSAMAPKLYEKDWFPEGDNEVELIKNARYCPAFWHELEFIKIICVLQGEVVLYLNHKKIVMKETDLCIISPNVTNAMFSSNDNDLVINIIMKRSKFEQAFASLLVENTRISDFFWQMLYTKNSNRVILFKCKNDTGVMDIVLKLFHELNHENLSSNIMVKSYIMLLFGYILRYYKEDSTTLGQIYENQERISHIIRYINENKSWITLPELAEHFHLSQGYLSRYIKRETGTTFIALLKKFRLQQAVKMLANSNCAIEEIIEAVGYTDTSRFYRNFKEMYGMTPMQYRKTIIL